MSKVTVHDFRVADATLAGTDPGAGDVVFLGPDGRLPFPFVVSRRLSGPAGTYIDLCEILAEAGSEIAAWEKTFELDGESMPSDVVDEIRHTALPGPGKYVLRYSVYGDRLVEIPFSAVDEDPPYGIVVPGPLDAALAKSTIAWLQVSSGQAAAIWYGYREGRIYVLTGPGEQQVPGLTGTTVATIIARSKDAQSRIGEAECAARVLPKDGEWDRIARDVLIGRRLNLTDGERALDRWRETCEIVALTPIPR